MLFVNDSSCSWPSHFWQARTISLAVGGLISLKKTERRWLINLLESLNFIFLFWKCLGFSEKQELGIEFGFGNTNTKKKNSVFVVRLKFSVSQTLFLSDALRPQLFQDVVKVTGVWVTVAGQVGAKLGFVMHLVPNDRICLARSAGCAHWEDQPAVPSNQQQLQHLLEPQLFRIKAENLEYVN